jgi:hypothetical protein
MGTTNLTVTAAIPTSITVTPFEVTIATNATQAYTAVVIYDIGTQATVTGQCMWTSSNTAVATIALGGGGGGGGMTATARGLGGGDTIITCTYTAQGVTVTGTGTLHVTPATVPVSLNITPDPNSCTVGGTAPAFVATVTLSNGTTQTVTNTATWTTADATIAGISTTGMTRGVATCLKTGMTVVTATYNNSGVTVTATATLNVEGMPTGVVISAAASSLLVGQSQAYTTSVLFSNNTSRVIPPNSTEMICSSSATGIATLEVMGNNRTGTCRGDLGTATFTCTYTPTGSTTSVMGTATLECQDQMPTQINIAPTSSTVAQGTVFTLTATATFADGSMMNITANAGATLTDSSNGTIVLVNNSGATKGQVEARSQGTATVKVTFRGIDSAPATITVGPVAPASLSITPTGGTLPVGSTSNFSAILLMSDKTTQDVTQTATWTSNATGMDGGTAIATVSNTGTRGVVTAVSAGTARITATYTPAGGTALSDFVNVTVP